MDKPSIYRECSHAVESLMESPPAQHGGVFTEIDVVAKAATKDWKKAPATKNKEARDDFKEGMKHANQVCGIRFRERKLCRYGPVTLPDGSQDYVRIASKIVYADAENGPAVFETPNGSFPRLMIHNDPLKAQGRRRGTVRNDLVSWKEQDLPEPSGAIDVTELGDLRTQLQAAIARAERAEAEAARLRSLSANGHKPADVVAKVEELEERLAKLEARDRKRAEIAAA